MKKKMTSRFALLMAIMMTMAVFFTACGGSNANAPADNGGKTDSSSSAGKTDTSSKEEVVELSFANVTSESAKVAAEKFKEIAYEESNGTIIVNLFHDNQLGDDRVAIEGTQLGEIDIAVSSTSPIAAIHPDFFAFDAPFLFKDEAHAYASLDGELGQQILGGLEKIGLKGLGYWENGMQAVANNTSPFTTPENMKGLKIRTMENEVYLSLFKSWTANPTPMAFAEIFAGLQQGTIDGVTTTLGAIDTNHFMDVQDYVTVLKYAYLPYFMCMNLDTYNSLSDTQKAAIEKAAVESVKLNRETSQAIEADFLARCEADERITVTYPTEAESAVLRQCVIDAGIYDLISSKMDHPEYFETFVSENS